MINNKKKKGGSRKSGLPRSSLSKLASAHSRLSQLRKTQRNVSERKRNMKVFLAGFLLGSAIAGSNINNEQFQEWSDQSLDAAEELGTTLTDKEKQEAFEEAEDYINDLKSKLNISKKVSRRWSNDGQKITWKKALNIHKPGMGKH
jgi:hypothetical protein